MANSLPFAVDFDSVLNVHLSSLARILERGTSASLDGLMCGIGPLGHKLFLASANSPDHPDVTFSIPFPRGITVGAFLETLLGNGILDAIRLLGMARISANRGDDNLLRSAKPLTDEMTKALLEKVCAAERAMHENKRSNSSNKLLRSGAMKQFELTLSDNPLELVPLPTTIPS